MEQEEIAKQLNRLMIENIKSRRAIHSAAVESAFRSVLRHRLLPPDISLGEAYTDTAIVLKRSAGDDQMTSGSPLSSSTMPSLLAAMLETSDLRDGMRILQIGTGSGYLAALIARLVAPSGLVGTVEIDEDIASAARKRLSDLGIANVRCTTGDGFFGWSDLGPFDRILVTAACTDVPMPWVDQLTPGGLLLLPLTLAQRAAHCPMVVFQKVGGILSGRIVPGLVAVGFVPLTGDRITLPVLFEPSLARLEMEIGARLSREGYRGADSQALYFLAMLCLAEFVERDPEGTETIDLVAAHRKAIQFLRNHQGLRIEGFSFRLTARGESPEAYKWHFAKGNHELAIGYEEARHDTRTTGRS